MSDEMDTTPPTPPSKGPGVPVRPDSAGPHKRKATKPPATFTSQEREKVRLLAAYGLSWPEIALVMERPERTLRKYLSQEFAAGTPTANAQVAASLFKQATGFTRQTKAGKEEYHPPYAPAAIFWLKCRAGWKETTVLETSTPGEDPTEKVIHALDRIAARIPGELERGGEGGPSPEGGAG